MDFATLPAMPRKPPQLAPNASDQARAIHAYLVKRGFTMAGWLTKAGLSQNALTELFNARSQSMNYSNLKKLADAAEASPAEIVGRDEWAKLVGGGMVDLATVRRAIALWSAARGRPDPEADARDIEAVILIAYDAGAHTQH